MGMVNLKYLIAVKILAPVLATIPLAAFSTMFGSLMTGTSEEQKWYGRWFTVLSFVSVSTIVYISYRAFAAQNLFIIKFPYVELATIVSVGLSLLTAGSLSVVLFIDKSRNESD